MPLLLNYSDANLKYNLKYFTVKKLCFENDCNKSKAQHILLILIALILPNPNIEFSTFVWIIAVKR